MSPLTGRGGVRPVVSLISMAEADSLLHGAGHVISHKRKLSYCHILRAKDAPPETRGSLWAVPPYFLSYERERKTIARRRDAGPLRI